MPPKKKRNQPSGPSYAGEVFCFTGFRDKDLSDLVEAAGGSVANSMTKAVTCVVCKSGSESTKKVQDAVAKGLKLLTKTELEDELKGNGSAAVAAAPPAKKGRKATAVATPATIPKKSAQAAKSAAIVAAAATAKTITTQVGCIDPIAMAQLDNGTEVAVDGNDIYDVALSQIDLSKNMDKYYIIQLLVIPPKKRYEDETYAVFTRWGKTGNAGQNMTSGPYDDLEDAITEFKDKFYSKTKNDWDDRHNFQAKKNQYKLIRVDHASKAARVSAARSGQVPKWEYYVDDFVDGKAVGWYPYTADGAEGAEDLWVTYQANSAMSTRVVESGIYHYSVDLVNMTQTNVDHPAKKMRHIRRTFMGNVTQGTNVGSSTSAAAAASAVTAPMSMAVLAATSVVASTAKSAVQAMSSAAASALALATPTPLTLATPVVPSALAATPRPVDSLCPLASKASMRVVDEYDIMLNQADIVKNANKFYRLQVLIDTSNGGYHFWTRWGRVGEGGQSSLVSNYGNSKASAVADFEKKFKDKTGVKFEDGPPYDAKSGKYEVIDMKVAASSAPVVSAGTAAFSAAGAAVAPPSKLDALTKQFMEIIFDADMFKSAMQDLHVDTTRMPLGALSASQLDKGFSVLRELQALLEKKKKTAQDNAAIVTLSGNFYQVIPHRFARHERPPPINTEDKLSEKFDMLNTLKDIEVAQRVERVGGASLTENPIDAKYRELAAELSLVDTTSGEFGIIKNFIDNTMGYRKVSLQNVWSVSREPEESTFTHFHALRNHRLLWHGTNVAVVAAILKSGLRIMPAVHGGRVGRGLYFADKLEKSTGYVRPTRLADGSQLGVLLLVQAAMGRMKEITRDDGSLRAAPPGFDSVLARGTEEPDYSQVATINFDGVTVTVPAGKMKNTGISSNFSQNEYLVYREPQQRLRYIVTFRF